MKEHFISDHAFERLWGRFGIFPTSMVQYLLYEKIVNNPDYDMIRVKNTKRKGRGKAKQERTVGIVNLGGKEIGFVKNKYKIVITFLTPEMARGY